MRAIRERLREDLDRLRTSEGYLRAGAPRYATLFGRDSLIAAWQALSIAPSIARATLRVLASYQGKRMNPKSEEEPGKILHEYRSDPDNRRELAAWEFPYYGSIDSTPLFLIVADAYENVTGDPSVVDELWDAIEASYRWMRVFSDRDEDGYLAYSRRNPHGLFHQGWKDGSADHLGITPPVALVEVQGYAIAARRAYARLARRRGDADASDLAAREATRTMEALDRDFWLPDVQFFALALDGHRRPRRAITSNPGHLLLVDAVQQRRAGPLVTRLFRDDMWTPYGIRTHASSEPDFDPYGYHTGTVWPHDNWFIHKGLLAQGRRRESDRVKEALLKIWDELGKIPELVAVVEDKLVDLSQPGSPTPANPLQAWSSSGLLDILSAERW